jgi:FlaA1/EpsC-like NDP-sugar epimerase
MTEKLLDWLRRLAARSLISSRQSKRMMALGSDAVSCVLATWISFSLRLGQLPWLNAPFFIFLATATIIALAIFRVRGVYDALFRFHGPHGLAQIANCCLLLACPLIVLFGLVSLPGVPRTLSVIFPVFLFVLVALSRIVARFVLLEIIEPGEVPQRVLIYGAGRAGRRLASSVQHEARFRLIAYCDDDPSLHSQKLEGVPIISLPEALAALERRELDLVLLAMPELSRAERSKLIERLQAHGAHVQTLPSLQEIVVGAVSVSDLRDVEITDLLARDPVTPDPRLLGAAITGKTVLITGAGGSIGSELCRQILAQRPDRLILFEMTEGALYAIDAEMRAMAASLGVQNLIVPQLGSLVDRESVTRLFRKWKPHTVFHAAAYKHVPLVEANIVAGLRNNVLGTLNCALGAIAGETERFILISTDKAVRPPNVMGASKRVCELILQALAAQHRQPIFGMVRFGNVLGSSGSVVPLFQQQIADGGPVTLTHRDVTRFFMTIPEAAELVIQAGAMAEGGEVYLLDMGEPVRIYDLARLMIQLSGRTVRDESHPDGDVEIVEIGLRDGEKLYEELLIEAEALSTAHSRIFRAREESIPWAVLEPELERIRRAVDEEDEPSLRASLARLVTGYGTTPFALAPSRPTLDETLRDFA